VHLTVDAKELVVYADTVLICAGQRELAGHHLIGGAREAGELDAERAMLEGVELGARL
jgi:2,4-dienoyl-CoA reductase (NADPH2)